MFETLQIIGPSNFHYFSIILTILLGASAVFAELGSAVKQVLPPAPYKFVLFDSLVVEQNELLMTDHNGAFQMDVYKASRLNIHLIPLDKCGMPIKSEKVEGAAVQTLLTFNQMLFSVGVLGTVNYHQNSAECSAMAALLGDTDEASKFVLDSFDRLKTNGGGQLSTERVYFLAAYLRQIGAEITKYDREGRPKLFCLQSMELLRVFPQQLGNVNLKTIQNAVFSRPSVMLEEVLGRRMHWLDDLWKFGAVLKYLIWAMDGHGQTGGNGGQQKLDKEDKQTAIKIGNFLTESHRRQMAKTALKTAQIQKHVEQFCLAKDDTDEEIVRAWEKQFCAFAKFLFDQKFKSWRTFCLLMDFRDQLLISHDSYGTKGRPSKYSKHLENLIEEAENEGKKRMSPEDKELLDIFGALMAKMLGEHEEGREMVARNLIRLIRVNGFCSKKWAQFHAWDKLCFQLLKECVMEWINAQNDLQRSGEPLAQIPLDQSTRLMMEHLRSLHQRVRMIKEYDTLGPWDNRALTTIGILFDDQLKERRGGDCWLVNAVQSVGGLSDLINDFCTFMAEFAVDNDQWNKFCTILKVRHVNDKLLVRIYE
uniref:RING-type domain-containing protein n=1 Tax=Globodera pallida TaxID=36090 RepID=A0A183CCI1_GLOPA